MNIDENIKILLDKGSRAESMKISELFELFPYSKEDFYKYEYEQYFENTICANMFDCLLSLFLWYNEKDFCVAYFKDANASKFIIDDGFEERHNATEESKIVLAKLFTKERKAPNYKYLFINNAYAHDADEDDIYDIEIYKEV